MYLAASVTQMIKTLDNTRRKLTKMMKYDTVHNFTRILSHLDQLDGILQNIIRVEKFEHTKLLDKDANSQKCYRNDKKRNFLTC